MATSTQAGNSAVPVAQVPTCQTNWHNVFDADRPMADISPVRHMSDHLSRGYWGVTVSVLNPQASVSQVTGVLEGTMDGTNFWTIQAISTTAGTAVTNYATTNPMPCKAFRVRVTSYTSGTATGYRVGVAVTGS